MVSIVSYNPEWPHQFEKESKLIEKALGSNCIEIHHFGSTAVTGMKAKPKIDILAVVKELSLIDAAALEKIGYESRGEVIPTGRYFSKKEPLRFHLHIFKEGNPLIVKNLSFRDWLRTHDEDRSMYESLKLQLAARHNDGVQYCDAKAAFIKKIIENASM